MKMVANVHGWNLINDRHRRTRRGSPPPPPRIFQIAIFGPKKKSRHIQAKPLDFRASNGENIWATDLSPPKWNWSCKPMMIGTIMKDRTNTNFKYCISCYFCEGFYFREFCEPDPREKFPLQFMSIYSNDNIRKIAKLTTRELPHLVQKRENNCTRK